jgi:hypothetical protein
VLSHCLEQIVTPPRARVKPAAAPRGARKPIQSTRSEYPFLFSYSKLEKAHQGLDRELGIGPGDEGGTGLTEPIER